MDTMKHNLATPGREQSAAVAAIRDVCNQTDPVVLWEALAAKGIDTTPGMIYRCFHKTQEPACAHTPDDDSVGLSAKDMATVSALAVKAGGVDGLIRLLEAWQEHRHQDLFHEGIHV